MINSCLIKTKARNQGPRERLYDTLQVTPNACTCRVPFGANEHHKFCCTSSRSTADTEDMDTMLMQEVSETLCIQVTTNSRYHAETSHEVPALLNDQLFFTPRRSYRSSHDAAENRHGRAYRNHQWSCDEKTQRQCWSPLRRARFNSSLSHSSIRCNFHDDIDDLDKELDDFLRNGLKQLVMKSRPSLRNSLD